MLGHASVYDSVSQWLHDIFQHTQIEEEHESKEIDDKEEEYDDEYHPTASSSSNSSPSDILSVSTLPLNFHAVQSFRDFRAGLSRTEQSTTTDLTQELIHDKSTTEDSESDEGQTTSTEAEYAGRSDEESVLSDAQERDSMNDDATIQDLSMPSPQRHHESETRLALRLPNLYEAQS